MLTQSILCLWEYIFLYYVKNKVLIRYALTFNNTVLFNNKYNMTCSIQIMTIINHSWYAGVLFLLLYLLYLVILKNIFENFIL
jgi:hypothetical protein